MKPPPLEYFAPTRLEEAVELGATYGNAKFLAGGQTLMPMLAMRFVLPDQIIDLNTVKELSFIREEGAEIAIGAMTRQRVIERSPMIRTHLPILPKALEHVGHLQTRNRGTIGGSLCFLDPSAELPAVAMAHDAVLEAVGPRGTRRISMADFPSYYMTPCLAPDEILSVIRFKPWPGRCVTGFSEFSRRHGDFAIAGAIALLCFADDGKIARASITAFGIAQAPVRVTAAEELVVGNRPAPDLFATAADHCLGLATLEDSYASADYRAHVAHAMIQRALAEAADEDQSSGPGAS